MTARFIDSKYQIIRQLGQGGMGAVYEARHIGTGRRVAVKVIISQTLAAAPDIVHRFQREARASGAIDSEHVVQVLDTGVDPLTQDPYMVMDLLNGEDVQQLLQRTGPLAPNTALCILCQACMGLRKAHEAGIVHRDIKSANLFLSKRESGNIVVKLLDFGIAKVRADPFAASGEQSLTRTGSMLGSPLYMSPEQAKGSKDIDHRSDIWSLGVVFYEALSGAAPNAECDTIGSLILAICSSQLRPLQDCSPWVPPEVAAIVHKALARDPALRFQSAAEMQAAITALIPHGSSLNEAMLWPVSPAMRTIVAPRLSVTGLESSTAVSMMRTPGVGFSQSAPGTTTTGLGATHQVMSAVSRSSRRRWIEPLAVTVLIGTGVVTAFALQKARHPMASDASASTLSVTGFAASIPAQRPVTLEIAPTDAKVDVDGADTMVRDGKVDLYGAIGSVHRVRLTQSGRSTTVDVVIAQLGPVPSRVELTGLAASAPVHREVRAQPLAAPVTTASTASPATNKATPTTKGIPEVDRNFN